MAQVPDLDKALVKLFGKTRGEIYAETSHARSGSAVSEVAKTRVTFQGQETPGGQVLDDIAHGIMKNHFENMAAGTKDTDIFFESGLKDGEGNLLHGIRVSATQAGRTGRGIDYEGQVQIHKAGEVRTEPFLANVLAKGPALQM